MDTDGSRSLSKNEVDDRYHTLHDAINHYSNQDGELTVDELAGAYKHSNIHERGAKPDCFTGTNGQKICEGDRVGDLQMNGGVPNQEAAFELARKHFDMGDRNKDEVITRDEVPEEYKTFFESIDYHTSNDGKVSLSELMNAYKYANIYEAREGTQGKCF